MSYTYKKIKSFATRLSKELGLKMRVHKKGKTLVYFLGEWLDLLPFAWVDINIGTYDKWMQRNHLNRGALGGGDWYELSDFDEETQAMVRDARRKGKVVVWIEMAVRNIRHKRENARCALINGSRWKAGDEDFDVIKQWLEEQRATIAPEDVAALKVVNSRGFDYPYYDKQSETIMVESENYKYGLLDRQGKIICEPLYDSIRLLRNGNIVVSEENRWSLINRNGEILKSIEYDRIENFNDGLAVVTLGGKYGIIDESCNLLGELKYDMICQLWSVSKYDEEDKFAEYFQACIDGKWGFLNKQGKEMSLFVYDYIQMSDFESGFIGVCKDGKWGYVNDKCEEVCPIVYDEIQMSDLATGFVRVCKDGKWGYINDKCEEMCEFKYEFDWEKFLKSDDKFYKPNAYGVLEEYEEADEDYPF